MYCTVCNSSVDSFNDPQLDKKFYQCPHCELIFLDKKFYVAPIAEKKQYDNHNNSFEDSGYVQMFENFLNFFWDDIKENTKTALDFGCGPGPVLYELIKRRNVKSDCYDKFYQTQKIYENKKYDLITSTEVFEHLDNPKEVLNFLTTLLNNNGVIALMTLFHTNKQSDFLKWWYRRDPTHITFFTPKCIEIMANECGLNVIKHDNKRIIILQKK
ncbi:class I SAM-dependent methyltransferase [Sulfurospirillum arcachonense]|uniref:class I SAM-dependent methyltransferase n=1 Tax=Sulfurospirillum arcachonense TaxID=57666 RepID=UPI0004685A18|nr:class I SAM-dependent methyltransferase [Sulfurospirillum arcachonense]